MSLLISGFLVAQALTAADIVYPVAELGNCKDEAACRAYCDKPENMKICLSLAEKYNLLSKEELQQAKKFDAIGKGPGGCKTQEACETYCNDMSRIDECVAFAEKNDLMPPKELEEAKKIQAAIKRGVKPPPCGNKKACDAYCSESEHMEECITFGEAAGFIPPEELQDAKKMLEAVKKGAKPPPCKGKDECDTYCSEPEHTEACMEFAIAAGFVSQEEAKEMEQVLSAVKKGAKMPPCKGKDACDKWCGESEANMAQCTDFAVAAGFMSEKDAEMAKKTGGKGPGGCKGKEECEAFCNNPANQETCFNFGKENGMISEGDLRQMEEGKQHMTEGLNSAPAEVMDCLASKVGSELIEKMKAGTAMPSKEMGEAMQECFGKMGPPPGAGGQGGPGGPGGSSMPGAAGAIVKLKLVGGNHELQIISASGIKEFSIQPTAGSAYSGGLNGCPTEYKTITMFDPSGFPLKAKITDCQDKSYDIDIPSEGSYDSGGGSAGQSGGMGPSGDMMPPSGMMPSGGGGQSIIGQLQTLPTQVFNCLKETVGEEVLEKIKTGQMPPADFGQKMQSCVGEFVPPQPSAPSGQPAGGMMPPAGMQGMQPPAGMEGIMPPGGTTGPGTPGTMPGKDLLPLQGIQPPMNIMGPPPEGSMTAPPAGSEGMMPPGNLVPQQPPQGQVPFVSPTGPGAGGSTAPGESGPGPGTAPPTEPTAPPPPSSQAPTESLLSVVLRSFLNLLGF